MNRTKHVKEDYIEMDFGEEVYQVVDWMGVSSGSL
jgi:hypothetical protein